MTNSLSKKLSVLIVGHGSREAKGNQEFEELVQAYRQEHPEFLVREGYIELAEPILSHALAQAAQESDQIVVVPLMLFAAGHVKNDIPLALAQAREKFPHVSFTSAQALGVHPKLAELMFVRASSVLSLAGEDAKKTAVIVVGRGSSDPDANGDFCKLVRLFSEGRGFLQCAPSFIGITGPSFEEMVEVIARSRPENLVVLPYMLFSGRLISKLEGQVKSFSERYPWIKTVLAPYLGSDRRLLDLIQERALQALEGQAPLPCDTCQYRVPLPSLTENVGGLKALLWSIRHTYTHSQAAPHRHAHKPVRKHIFVCGNIDCADRGSIPLVETLRRLIKDAKKEKEFQVTRTSCMGRCGEGPTVVVYPDGIWYRNVQEEDAKDLVNEHLLEDKLVSRLVDNIMS